MAPADQSAELLDERARKAHRVLRDCILGPRECHVNRLENQRGFCRTGARAMVSSVGPHFGEEAPLVGSHGSGTIFFAGCPLGCLFCQNYDISHLMAGEEVSEEDLVQQMLALQGLGCHNINLVSASHYLPHIVHALFLATQQGLCLPIVYNTNGEKVSSINASSLKKGHHAISWNGCDNSGIRLAEGLYICNFESPDFCISKKLILQSN